MNRFWKHFVCATIVLSCCLPLTAFAQLSHLLINTAHINNGNTALDVATGIDGTVFLANMQDGLRAYNYNGASFTNTAHIDDGGLAFGVAVGADGTVFLANHNDGLRAYSYDGSSFTNTAHIDNGGVANGVAVGADGTIFLANGDDGLRAYTYDGTSFTNTAHIDNGGRALDLTVHFDGTIFLANLDDGLRAYSYDGSSFTNTAHINDGGTAADVALDFNGIIFLANSSDGLRAYSYDGLSFTNTAHIGYPVSDALGVTVSVDGTVFLANLEDGLLAFRYDDSSFTNTAHIDNGGEGYDVAIGPDGTIFLANNFDGLRAYRYLEITHTFIVRNTNDAGSGSLRRAIIDANAIPNIAPNTPDIIRFDIEGPVPHTIQPDSALPDITDAVIIDGTTEPDANCDTWPGTLSVELDGTNAGVGASGLTLNSGASFSTIRGLVINRFDANGILVVESNRSKIDCNFIGIDVTGTVDLGNGNAGVKIANNAYGITVGGIEEGSGNIISGNGAYGVAIIGTPDSDVRENRVLGNRIGTNAAGTAAIPNDEGGVEVEYAKRNQIGGFSDWTRNVISGNGDGGSDVKGIYIANADSNLIHNNYIGTNAAGTAAVGNAAFGIRISASTFTRVFSNVISGNNAGLFIYSSESTVVHSNFIGTDVSGTMAIPNNFGIVTTRGTRASAIGGTFPGQGNLISGNIRSGISMSNATDNIIRANLIGTDITGSAALGNGEEGIVINGGNARFGVSRNNFVGGLSNGAGNIIAFNGGNGIGLSDRAGSSNAISGNSIFNNGLLGIDLGIFDSIGVSANDQGDSDMGVNNFQNYPLLTSAETDGSEITITGTFNSTANTNDFVLEFFANSVCNGDQNGNPQSDDYGEGETFLGFTTVNTDANGNASFSINLTADVAIGTFISATATSPDSSTSEFSQCIEATDGSLHNFLLLSAMDIEISGLQLSAGDMHANDDITFNKGFPGTHTGNLSAVDNIDISSKNTIDGDVNAGGDLDNDGTINGAANGSASVDPIDLPTLDPFTAGTEDVTVDGDDDVTLPPGMNKDVVVERDGTLRLNAGEYFLNELEFGTDTRLIVDVSGGDVIVNIVSDLEFGQRMIISVEGGSTSRFIINSIQTKNIDFGREATVIATIIAPDAKVRAGSYVRFSGSICAKDISFSSGPVIVGHNASLPKVVVNDEADIAELPQAFALAQNYPNPFNPTTNIGFQITNFEFVQLKIYDVSGRLVRTLVNEHRAAGNYTVSWDATNDFGAKVASGIYLYKLQAADFVQVKKMVLLK